MDLKVFHDTVRYFLNKEQGGWISDPEIDNLADRGQMWWFVSCLPMYGKNQKSTDPLSTFSTKLDFTTGTDGIITLPTDPTQNPCYETLPTVSISYYDGTRTRYKPVKLLSEDEITERRGSQILEPTVTDPVGLELQPGKIQLYPEAAMTGYVYYLRRPLVPFYAFTGTGREKTYNKVGSTQLEWAETSINKILIKTLQLAGVPMNDEMLIQFTELKNNQDI
jgi:hypothetical protein